MLTVSPAAVLSEYAPPAKVALQYLQCHIPVLTLFTAVFPHTSHLYRAFFSFETAMYLFLSPTPYRIVEFDIGPPSPEAIELARVVDRGIRAAGVIDLKKLFIEEEKVWDTFVDIYVLNYDGNLFDASTLAATTALLSARMPRYENEEVIREGNLGKLPTANIVTSSTFATMANKLILDPSGNEELFMDARITIATDESNVRAMQKGLSGGFAANEVEQLIDLALEKSKNLRQEIKKTIGE